MPLCECGCGQECKNRFVINHNKRNKPTFFNRKGCKQNGLICPKCNKIHKDTTGNNNPSRRSEFREMMSKIHKGKIISEKQRRQHSETMKRMFREEKIIPTWKGKPSPRRGMKQPQTSGKNNPMYGKKRPEIGKLMSNRLKGKTYEELHGKEHADEIRRKIGIKSSLIMTKAWSDSNFKEKRIRATLRGCFLKRPSSLEKQFIGICKKHNLPFKYTGDGSFLIGYKNPDFIESNGKKICIEVRNNKVCKYLTKCTPEKYAENRINYFSKYGWKCIVFLTDNKLDEQSVIEFLYSNS